MSWHSAEIRDEVAERENTERVQNRRSALELKCVVGSPEAVEVGCAENRSVHAMAT